MLDYLTHLVKQQKAWLLKDEIRYGEGHEDKKAKAVAEKHFLCRKISKKSSRILKEFPDIGKTIEAYEILVLMRGGELVF